MSRTITTEVYQYEELDERAQGKARDWFRSGGNLAEGNLECVLDEFPELASALGWTIHSQRGHNAGRAIYYSGFCSQGDGACFHGDWYARDCKPADFLKDRPVTHRDATGAEQVCEHNKRLHEAAAPFIDLAARFPLSSGSSSYGHSRHCHEYSTRLAFESGIDRDDETHTSEEWKQIYADDLTLEEEFSDAARDLMNFLYRWLESEYEYANSDEQVAETIVANEYEFTITGERA